MKQEKYVENIQEILQKRLAYIPRLHVVAVSALDSMEKLTEKYGSSLRRVVGTVEPNIPGVLFITADRVFSREGILAIASIVDDWGMDAWQARRSPPAGKRSVCWRRACAISRRTSSSRWRSTALKP